MGCADSGSHTKVGWDRRHYDFTCAFYLVFPTADPASLGAPYRTAEVDEFFAKVRFLFRRPAMETSQPYCTLPTARIEIAASRWELVNALGALTTGDNIWDICPQQEDAKKKAENSLRISDVDTSSYDIVFYAGEMMPSKLSSLFPT